MVIMVTYFMLKISRAIDEDGGCLNSKMQTQSLKTSDHTVSNGG